MLWQRSMFKIFTTFKYRNTYQYHPSLIICQRLKFRMKRKIRILIRSCFISAYILSRSAQIRRESEIILKDRITIDGGYFNKDPSTEIHLKFWLNIGDKLCLESAIHITFAVSVQTLWRPRSLRRTYFDLLLQPYWEQRQSRNRQCNLNILYSRQTCLKKCVESAPIRHPRNENTKKITPTCK